MLRCVTGVLRPRPHPLCLMFVGGGWTEFSRGGLQVFTRQCSWVSFPWLCVYDHIYVCMCVCVLYIYNIIIYMLCIYCLQIVFTVNFDQINTSLVNIRHFFQSSTGMCFYIYIYICNSQNLSFSASSGGSVEGYFAGERDILDALNRWVNAFLSNNIL